MRLLLLLAALSAAAASALAADGDPEVTRLRLGFADRYKVGYWTPVEVTLTGGNASLEGQLEVIVPDGDGVPTKVVSPPDKLVEISPGGETRVSLFAKIGQKMPDISVRFLVNGDEKAARSFRASQGTIRAAFDSNRPQIVTVGDPLGVASSTGKEGKEKATFFTAITAASQFPTRWYGYDAADAVMLCTSDPAVFGQLSPSSAEIAALDRWVRLGGQLILSVGSNAGDVLAAGAPLAQFAPGNFMGLAPLNRTNAWESYAETSQRLDAQGEILLDAPRLENVRGTIEAFEGSRANDLPLVVRTPHGLGEIVFVAADLDRPPFTTWPARTQMLEKLLARSKPASDATQQNSGASTTFGYGDIAGQLRTSLEQFAGVELIPFSLVAFLILLYILAIGPLDYLLLKRGLKRMEWTWFSFPAIVLAFSLTAYLLAHWLKGNQLLTNQVDVIDYDAQTKLVRGTTWSNVFSPEVDSYDLTYQLSLPNQSKFQAHEPLVSWMGLPGDGFGGMSGPAGTAPLFTGAYSFSPSLDALNGMPIAVWSTKGLIGRWSGTADSPIVAELMDSGDNLLSGNIQSKLDEPLTDCVLVYDRWAYAIGTLEAHARLSVGTRLDPQTVETYFKRQSLFNEQSASSTYDPASLDVGRIVETMMFYRHLGGSDYAKLSNQYQQFIDLSGLLRCGRAILIGRGPPHGGQLLRDGKPMENSGDRRWTFYRFVFPVGARDGALR